MLKLLTIESEFSSAEKLGFETHVYLPEEVERSDNDLVIRWGNSRLYETEDGKAREFKHVINPSEAIKRNVEKHKALIRLASVVDVPRLYLQEVPKGKLAVVRPLRHTSGNGFEVRTGPYKLSSDYYATEYVKTRTEYRVWFAGDNFMCAKRVARKGTKEDRFVCRSNYLYKFCKMPAKLARQVKLAAKTIGLTFGAADVLRVKRKFYFCELNAACSIDHRKIRLFYQKHIPEIAKRMFPGLVHK